MLKKIIFSLVLFFIFTATAYAEDSITISTYYPSPYGVYNRLQTNSLGVGDNNNNGRLDSGDVPLAVSGSTNGEVWIAGNVGIGIGATAPTAGLDVVSNIRIRGAGAGDGKLLTSDANGYASWQSNSSVLPGTVCGHWSSTGQDGRIPCNGFNPSVECPPGYTKNGQRHMIDSVVQVVVYSCLKD